MNKTNVLLFMENCVKTYGNRVALGMKSESGWTDFTFNDLDILSRKLANYLIKIGIKKGDRVAILSESRPEFGISFFASVIAGAITIPLDVQLTEFEFPSILNSCQPKVLFVSSKFLETGLKLKETIDSIETIVIIDEQGINSNIPCLYSMPDDDNKVKWRHRALGETVLIAYTSGTTDKSKGIEVSFKNIMYTIDCAEKHLNIGSQDKLLSFLPMNHLFELVLGLIVFLSKGSSVYYPNSLDPKDLRRAFREKQITFMITVPAFLNIIKTIIEKGLSRVPFILKFFFYFNHFLSFFIPVRPVRRFLFMFVHIALGRKFRGWITGGSPLEARVARFFQRMGFVVIHAYGSSEAMYISSDKEDHNKIGSVGTLVPGVQAKIDKETKELMIKSDGIMKGYYNNPELTAEVIDSQGWFHTGDVAKIDRSGFVYITGRIKSIITLSGGKKVFPEDVEAILEQSPNFAEVCVFGARNAENTVKGTENVFAAILPSKELMEKYTDFKELEEEIIKEINELSEKLSEYKRPSNIIVVKEPFPRTATKKIKRNEVKKALVKD